ncbi:hypothetical protein RKD23_006975 [Streptomyces sp. SAI-170]|uniref:LppU/SCO3897 family protein n=1 Tax=Streptomyces sp. SAI-170 TaxID=3377729 RepID=UPI003C7CAD03
MTALRRAAVAVLLAGAVVTGCGQAEGYRSDGAAPTSASPSPGEELDVDDCVAKDDAPGSAGDYEEVPCTDHRAEATVLAVFQDTAPADPRDCPERTDDTVDVPWDAGSRTVAQLVCVRNRTAPHPGDPGQGGGPHLVVGDCLRVGKEGWVSEVVCRGGSPADRATHQVVEVLVDQRVSDGIPFDGCAAGLTPVVLKKWATTDTGAEVACSRELD